MAMAGSLNFRVIFKATFESSLPPGGFLQKDFPPDFYLVLCTIFCFVWENFKELLSDSPYGFLQTLPGLCLTHLHLQLEF